MKFGFLTFLLLTNLLHSAPRISQISPTTGVIFGRPLAADLDQDGDLDIAYLINQQPAFHAGEVASQWLENLGNHTFSPPKTLGLHFQSLARSTFAEALITPPGGPTQLMSAVKVTATGALEIYSKSIHSSSWNLARRFPDTDTCHFLQSPAHDLPILITRKTSSTPNLDLWELPAFRFIGTISSPAPTTSDPSWLKRFHAVDLDLDGDSDLINFTDGETHIFEQTSPLNFESQPIVLSISLPIIGDLNGDDLPDFLSTRRSSAIINQGALTFESRSISLPFSGVSATAIGKQGANPAILGLNNYQDDQVIQIITLDSDLQPLQTRLIETGSIYARTSIAADFDQDGTTDLAFISSSKVPYTIATSGHRGGERSVTSLSRPSFDSVQVYWGNSTPPSSPVPAYPHSPISCANPAVGDFNNDQSPDLIIGPDLEGQLVILLNDGSGAFPTSRVLEEMYPDDLEPGAFTLQNLVPVDFDNDGNLDLSLTLAEKTTDLYQKPTLLACAIAMGRGDGTFAPLVLPPGSFDLVARGFCEISQFADMDGDGDLDAVLPGAWRENLNGILRTSAYPLIQNTSTTDALGNSLTPTGQLVADFDGDGAPDIMVPSSSLANLTAPGNPVLIYPPPTNAGISFNTGNGGMTNPTERQANLLISDALGNPIFLPFIALDLDLDGTVELLTAGTSTDALGNPFITGINHWKFDPDAPRDFTLAQSLFVPTFAIPFTNELADFNGDGELEYVAESQYLTPTPRGPLISPVYNFKGEHLTNGYAGPIPVAVADFDNDGDTDALYSRGFSGLYLVRNSIVDEDSAITTALIALGQTPAMATPDADADQDGRSNALEYIQGTDPLLADQAPPDFSAPALSPDGSQLIFERPAHAGEFDLHYQLEISFDLTNWAAIPSALPTIISSDETTQQVSVEIPRSHRISYFRISATHDPRRSLTP
ncbi:VCBS repeat-containing protein [Verrucomicrobiaceae bacterium 227]